MSRMTVAPGLGPNAPCSLSVLLVAVGFLGLSGVSLYGELFSIRPMTGSAGSSSAVGAVSLTLTRMTGGGVSSFMVGFPRKLSKLVGGDTSVFLSRWGFSGSSTMCRGSRISKVCKVVSYSNFLLKCSSGMKGAAPVFP